MVFKTNGSKPFTFYTDDTMALKIVSGGGIGIGTSDLGTSKLNVDGSIGFAGDTTKYLYMPNVGQGTGSIYMQAGFGSSQAGGAIRLYGHNATSYTGGDVEVGLSGKGNFLINATINGTRLLTLNVGGNLGLGVNSPVTKLDVNGNIKNAGRVYSGNAVTGNISTNLLGDNGRNYILVCDLNDVAGFSLSGSINAASYTCWNISDFWIIKNYSSFSSAAGITGKYKGGGCDMNIVDLNYGGGRFLAIGYTSNPEIDVLWTGYRLLHMLNSDGSAIVVPQSNCTINSTLASY
jgi:hypothetical protein